MPNNTQTSTTTNVHEQEYIPATRPATRISFLRRRSATASTHQAKFQPSSSTQRPYLRLLSTHSTVLHDTGLQMSPDADD